MRIFFFIIVFFLFISDSFATTSIDLQFGKARVSISTYCVTIQARSKGNEIGMRDANIAFSYNNTAINNPVAAPINYSSFTRCEEDIIRGQYLTDFSFAELAEEGQATYTINLASNEVGCPTIGDNWISIVEVCFDIQNATESADLNFFSDKTNFSTGERITPYYTNGYFRNLDAYVLTSGSTMKSEASFKAAIYPYKAATNLNMYYEMKSPKDMYVVIYDAMSKIVEQQPLSIITGEQEQKIDVKHLKTGAYMIQITDGKERINRKFVII